MCGVSQATLGWPVDNWVEPIRPTGAPLCGVHVELHLLTREDHAAELFAAFGKADGLWAYLPYGPFASVAAYGDWIDQNAQLSDPTFYALIDKSNQKAVGVASYLRINPSAGSIEVGHICLSPQVQKTKAATEAMFLMMQWAFGAGYRRYEWKCDALNLPSRRAAARLGLSYEGVFRQMSIVKGRNRDTAWFAAVNGEWSLLRDAFNAWLAAENFMQTGQQLASLSDMTAPLLSLKDPLSHPSK
jgi:RimJ/RimL family protein N-acetyltransferase